MSEEQDWSADLERRISALEVWVERDMRRLQRCKAALVELEKVPPNEMTASIDLAIGILRQAVAGK